MALLSTIPDQYNVFRKFALSVYNNFHTKLCLLFPWMLSILSKKTKFWCTAVNVLSLRLGSRPADLRRGKRKLFLYN